MKKLYKVLVVVALLVITCCFAFGCSPTSTTTNKGLLLKKFGTDSYYTVYGYVDDGTGVTTLNIEEAAKEIDENIVVGRIKANAFNGNSTLTEIIVPTTVEVMDEGAFAGIKRLEKITIPFVGKYENADCYLNETAKADKKAVDFARTFGYLFGQTEFAGGAKVTQSYNSTSTTDVYIPQSLTEITIKPAGEYKIPMYAFAGNTVVNKIVLDGEFTAIGEYAFSGLSNLRNVNIPATVKTLYKGAFANCANLKDQGLVFDANCTLQIIGENAFEGVGLNNLVVPQTVTSIGARAFKNSKLINVTLPAIEKVNDYTFYNCEFLKEVVINSATTEIGNEAFYNCKALNFLGKANQKNTNESKVVYVSGLTLGSRVFEEISGLTIK